MAVTPKAKRRVAIAATGIWMTSSLLWFLVSAYANWLRFSSPKAPDLATGQVVYTKASKGVFYITEAQALVVHTSVWPIWMAAVFGIVVAGWAAKGADFKPSIGAQVVAVGYLASIAALFFFGNSIMALIFTGSFSLPS